MKRARRIVLAGSTMSFWAAFLAPHSAAEAEAGTEAEAGAAAGVLEPPPFLSAAIADLYLTASLL